jgi:molybdopterin-guanine dinucleotide biosynthesis protein A
VTSIFGVIIAGGQGHRLGGVRKADIRIGGVRLIERVARVLGALERPLMVATGPEANDLVLGPQFWPASDIEGSQGGPLAGLAAAVLDLQWRGILDGILVSVAVDTPFLPDDYVARLLSGLDTSPASFAGWKDAFYPPNAAWRLEAIADLPERLGETASLKELHQRLGAARVSWDEAEANPFDNLNTLADLVALGERANRMALM